MPWRGFQCLLLLWYVAAFTNSCQDADGAIQLAGNLANLPANDLNALAFEYLGARLLYMAVYMGVRSEAASYLRTGIWAWSISIPIWALYKAGKQLNVE